MREMWELPSSTVKTKLIRWGVVLALVWALVAAPLTVWLAVRAEPAPPPPPDRELTVTEKLAATLVSERLSQGYITLTHQVTTPVAKFEVTEAVQAASGDSIGPVKSMLLELDIGAVRAIVERHLASQAPKADLKAELADFARAGGVPI